MTLEHGIDLWLTFYNEIVDPELLAAMAGLLSAAEREQQQRFVFADDRLRYLVTRAMARTVLSRYAAVAPTDWEFIQNPYGRPAIAPHHPAPGLCFNISHTKGLIALAVSRGWDIGIDVENLSSRQPALDIADHFFSPAEVAALAAVPLAQRRDLFFEYWTFKESYIKARGMGLSLPLDRFSFYFPAPHLVRLVLDDALADDAGRWHFRQCRPTPRHLLALCAQWSGERPPAVALRTIVPGAYEQVLEVTWLRSVSSS